MPYPTQWANYDPQKFMCCLCYKILDISECAINKVDGKKIDVCIECKGTEIWIAKNLIKKIDVQHVKDLLGPFDPKNGSTTEKLKE